jgi:nucleotide-binding universal stress UspA family protein
MKKKILIPTDFSNNATNAITYAANLYKDTECDFYLLNTYDINNPSRGELRNNNPQELSFESEKVKSENGLSKTIEMIDFKQQNRKHHYHVISLQEDPLEAITAIVEKKDIELVVMGTKGSHNRTNRLFGSNTINIMENLRSCPVMGIPLDADNMQVKEIVFPTNYKTPFKRRELVHLVEIAQLHDANICVLYISDQVALNTDQEEHQQLLNDCFSDASHSFHQVKADETTEGIQRFIESRDSDMIAFINSKHTFFGGIFSTPMVKELGLFSKIPILVLHDI